MAIRVRPASPEDAPAIARVHVRTWQSAYRGLLAEDFLESLSEEARAQRWREILLQADPYAFTMVAEQDGRIVGFVSGGPERSGDPLYSGEVYAIYILPAHQRKGIGRLLIREAVQALLAQGFSNMLIWVLSDNPSGAFYEALGGQFVREQPIEIGAQTLTEAAYGWIGITPLAR